MINLLAILFVFFFAAYLVKYVQLLKTFKDIKSTILANNQILNSQLPHIEKEQKIQLAAKATLKLFFIALIKNLIVFLLPIAVLFCLSFSGLLDFNVVIGLLLSIESFIMLTIVIFIYWIKVKYG